MKKIALIALSLFSLQGCVTITSEVDGEEAVGYEDGEPVSSDHKLFHAVTVGEATGFSGTSIFPITGDVSPDMSNEGVEFALAETLRNASMLSVSDKEAQYILNADFVWNNEEGALGLDGPFMIHMIRETKINYVLDNAEKKDKVYEGLIHSFGDETSYSLAPSYINEKRTAVPSYKRNFTQLIEELKALKL